MPALEDGVIRLRALCRNDLPLYAAIEDTPDEWLRSSPQLLKPITSERRVADFEKALQSSEGSHVLWVIERVVPGRDAASLLERHLPSGPPIGFLGFFFADTHNRSIGLGIHLLPDCRGQGIGRRALELAKQYAFMLRGLHRLWLETLDDNHAMQKVALAAGFQLRSELEGTSRQSWWLNGKFHDRKCFGMLASDYQPQAA